MFGKTNNTPGAPEPPAVQAAPTPTEELIPLCVFALGYPEPLTGWRPFLADLGVKVRRDDIGWDCISRVDAGWLMSELLDQREQADQRRREAEQRAIEADRQWRAQLNPGVPWYRMPAGVDPARALMEADRDVAYAGRPQSVTAALLEAELGGGEGTMVFHSLGPNDDAA